MVFRLKVVFGDVREEISSIDAVVVVVVRVVSVDDTKWGELISTGS